MTVAYRICRRLENGDVVHVALRSSHKDAEDLMRALSECWPGEYMIEKICGTDPSSSRQTLARYSERVQ